MAREPRGDLAKTPQHRDVCTAMSGFSLMWILEEPDSSPSANIARTLLMELLQFTSLSNQKNSFEFVSFVLLFVF